MCVCGKYAGLSPKYGVGMDSQVPNWAHSYLRLSYNPLVL